MAGQIEGAGAGMRRFLELSPRELEVLMEVRAGLTSKEIADELGISQSTVNKHVISAMRTLDARSRSHAVAILGDFLDTYRGEAQTPGVEEEEDAAAEDGSPEQLVRAIRLLLTADNAFYAAWDATADRLRVVAADGPQATAGQLFEPGSGAAGIAFQRDRAISSTDYSRLRRAHPDAVRGGAASAIAVPVRSHGEAVGVVAVGSQTALHFTPLHVELLSLTVKLASPRLVAALEPDAGSDRRRRAARAGTRTPASSRRPACRGAAMPERATSSPTA